jgi:cyclomaltodextrinase / maltogenic alpha-amylase / neopullulanase
MIKIGKYEHYKGGQYEVIGIAKHSETMEEFVVYKALYGEGELWIRPLKMFMEDVDFGGKKVSRFKYIGN